MITHELNSLMHQYENINIYSVVTEGKQNNKQTKNAFAQDNSVRRVQRIRSTRKWADERSKGQDKDGTMMSFVAFGFIAVGLACSPQRRPLFLEKWPRGEKESAGRLISSFGSPPKPEESQVHAQRTKCQMFVVERISPFSCPLLCSHILHPGKPLTVKREHRAMGKIRRHHRQVGMPGILGPPCPLKLYKAWMSLCSKHQSS